MAQERLGSIALLAWALFLPATLYASNHLVQIDEALAGANGDSKIQFIELKLCCPGENLWGPQSGEAAGRARLIFYDATGAQTGEFVFPSNPRDHNSGGVPDADNAVSVLIATPEFANLTGMPAPDFLIPSTLFMPGGGKVIFADNRPSNLAAAEVRLCLSNGNFAGDTGQDTVVPPNPAGPPAAALPITGASSLKRFQHFDSFGTEQFNADFQLGPPAPRNTLGQTGSLTEAGQVQQGETLFFQETFSGNSRTCATCHLPQDRFGLAPQTIGSLPNNDPLFVHEFNPDLTAIENACLVRSSRAVILENIDGFDKPLVYRGSPHLLNIALTAPYGLSAEFSNLRDFSRGAVHQHFPKTLARNSNPLAGPLDFREPTDAELAALEAFMNTIQFPADGDFDLTRMMNAAINRGANGNMVNLGRSLFFGPGNCFKCHNGDVLAEVDQSMIDGGLVTVPLGGSHNLKFNTGVVHQAINNSPEVNACLDAAMPPEAAGNREFSVPPLLGVSGTGPFFHDHSALTLHDAIAFYNTPEFNQSPAGILIGGTQMTPTEIDAITAFLEALEEPTFAVGPPLQLSISAIGPQSLGAPFDVTINVTDAEHHLVSVTQSTDIALTLKSGTGALGGNLTGTISNGGKMVTISGVTYDTVEKNVNITAAVTNGQTLSPANSNLFVSCPTLPGLTLSNPTGGENIQAGNLVVITWISANTTADITIDLFKGGQFHSNIGSAPATQGSFGWNVCQYLPNGNDYSIQIKVCHCAGCTTAVSGPFSITGSQLRPSFTLLTPNGGQTFTAGTTQAINWSSTNSSGDVNLELTKAGQLVQVIASVPPSDGSFSWDICSFVGDGSDYKVRMSCCDCLGCIEDSSDSTFTITGSQPVPNMSITLTSPTGGENWLAGTTHNITWLATNPAGDVAIDLLKGGQFFTSIGSAPMSAGNFTWDICELVGDGSDYTLRAIRCDCAGCVQDISDAPFTISGSLTASGLVINSPNGGETFTAGGTHAITWSTSETTGQIELFLYKGGDYYADIGTAPLSAGTFNWTICPSIGDGSDFTILGRYFNASCNQFVLDFSDADFAITGSLPPPTLTLTSPNGGESFQAGTTHAITWNSTSPGGTVNFVLAEGDNTFGEPIGSASMSAGTFAWTICPYIGNATDYRIIISSTCGAATLTDSSDGLFAITASQNPPIINLASPNGGENWAAGSAHPITWTSTPGTGDVTLTLLKGGQPLQTIGTTPLNSGSYNWLLSSALEPAADYAIQIDWQQCGQATNDISNTPFTIASPTPRTITQWRSVRTHSIDGNLAIILNPTATGNGYSGPTSETRSDGVQRIEVDFSATVILKNAAAVTVTGRSTLADILGPPVNYAPASVAMSDADTLAISFNPGDLPDETCYTIQISAGVLFEPLTGDLDINVRSLVGDTADNGQLSVADMLATRSKIALPATANPQHDVNLSGGNITLSDMLFIKDRVTSIPKQALCP